MLTGARIFREWRPALSRLRATPSRHDHHAYLEKLEVAQKLVEGVEPRPITDEQRAAFKRALISETCLRDE